MHHQQHLWGENLTLFLMGTPYNIFFIDVTVWHSSTTKNMTISVNSYVSQKENLIVKFSIFNFSSHWYIVVQAGIFMYLLVIFLLYLSFEYMDLKI